MNSKQMYLRNAVFLLLFTILFSSVLMAQKRPAAVDFDTNSDDDRLCGFNSSNKSVTGKGDLTSTKFCRLYKLYLENKDGNANGLRIARDARNDMINIIQGQIDSYYKDLKNGRRTKNKWFQFVLDVLEVGSSTAIAIMNGERAKTVVGAGLAGLQGGRTAFNKNFEILQMQVLINKMNEKRARILTGIVLKKDDPVSAEIATDAYRWEEAKNDLRDYLIAGTYNDALDTLVEETGEDSKEAKTILKGLTVGEIPEASLGDSRSAAQIIISLKKDLTEDDKKDTATKSLRAIVAALSEKNETIKEKLKDENITVTSEGEVIRRGLIKIKSDFNSNGKDDLVTVIDKMIIALAGDQ